MEKLNVFMTNRTVDMIQVVGEVGVKNIEKMFEFAVALIVVGVLGPTQVLAVLQD